MATVCCPNCNNEFQKPTSPAIWVLCALGGVCAVGFMFLVVVLVCLSAISSVGTASNEAFEEIAAQIELEQAASDGVSYPAVGQ